MDRLDAMSLLLTVVDAGSLSAAGRRLDIPLATVSRRIGDLETHLKTRLLQRTSRRVTLTDAGRDYVEACRRILDDVDAAERQASGEYTTPKGGLVVTSAMVFGRMHVVPVLATFLSAYPEIDVRLMLSDSVVDLVENRIDVGVRIAKLADSSLHALRLGTIQRVYCASPAYLERRGTPQRPQDLEESVRVRSRLVVNSAEAAVDAARAGAGIAAVFTYQAAQGLRSSELVTLPLETNPTAIPVSLVYAASGLLPLKLRAFLDYAAPRLKARLAG
jgi:DNA-binding transcriptional LysR family regulator